MKCIRIKIFQPSAIYSPPIPTVNKISYPLPPPSTVIGFIHTMCRWQEYHPMDVSITGRCHGYLHGETRRIMEGGYSFKTLDEDALSRWSTIFPDGAGVQLLMPASEKRMLPGSQ